MAGCRLIALPAPSGYRRELMSRRAPTLALLGALLLTSLLGPALFGAVDLAGHLLLRRWHASEKD